MCACVCIGVCVQIHIKMSARARVERGTRRGRVGSGRRGQSTLTVLRSPFLVPGARSLPSLNAVLPRASACPLPVPRPHPLLFLRCPTRPASGRAYCCPCPLTAPPCPASPPRPGRGSWAPTAQQPPTGLPEPTRACSTQPSVISSNHRPNSATSAGPRSVSKCPHGNTPGPARGDPCRPACPLLGVSPAPAPPSPGVGPPRPAVHILRPTPTQTGPQPLCVFVTPRHPSSHLSGLSLLSACTGPPPSRLWTVWMSTGGRRGTGPLALHPNSQLHRTSAQKADRVQTGKGGEDRNHQKSREPSSLAAQSTCECAHGSAPSGQTNAPSAGFSLLWAASGLSGFQGGRNRNRSQQESSGGENMKPVHQRPSQIAHVRPLDGFPRFAL